MEIKLKKGIECNYKYQGYLIDFEIYILDDGKSFGWSEFDKNGNILFSDGWYGLRLKDIKDQIRINESQVNTH